MCANMKQHPVHMFSLSCGSGKCLGWVQYKVIPLPPWVEGSLPALKGEMLADAPESKDSHDFSSSHLG